MLLVQPLNLFEMTNLSLEPSLSLSAIQHRPLRPAAAHLAPHSRLMYELAGAAYEQLSYSVVCSVYGNIIFISTIDFFHPGGVLVALCTDTNPSLLSPFILVSYPPPNLAKT